MERAVQINAFVKAINIAATDPDRLLQVAAHLTTIPWLRQWQFAIRQGRLVADRRPEYAPPTNEHEFVAQMLNLASRDEKALEAAGQYLQAMPWYKDWRYRVQNGALVLAAPEEGSPSPISTLRGDGGY